jgi:hypothetical protein
VIPNETRSGRSTCIGFRHINHGASVQLWLCRNEHASIIAQPLGTGPGLVESLTGYVARLAEAHDVSAAILLNRELLPRMARISAGRRAPKNLTFSLPVTRDERCG